MPVFRLMYKFKNWFGKRDENLLAPDHVPVTQWLEQSLNSQDDPREFHPERTSRSSLSLSLRRLSMAIIKIDKETNSEECRCLATNMCPNGTSDPIPCVIHAVDRS